MEESGFDRKKASDWILMNQRSLKHQDDVEKHRANAQTLTSLGYSDEACKQALASFEPKLETETKRPAAVSVDQCVWVNLT